MTQIEKSIFAYSNLLRIEAWMFENERLQALTKEVSERFIGWNPTKPGLRQLLIVVANLFANWAEGEGTRTAIPIGAKNVCKAADWHRKGLRKSVLSLVPELVRNDAVRIHMGSRTQDGAPPHFSQIWAADNLLRIFEHYHPEDFLRYWKLKRARIVLRDTDKFEVETSEADHPEFVKSRDRFLSRYNDLMNATVIDIPSNEAGYLDRFAGKAVRVRIPFDKSVFVRSIFNETFEFGGRFYGGIWQEIPRRERQKLCLNGEPTVELDYGALHMVLAYASVGLDYASLFGSGNDAYALPVLSDFQDSLVARRIAKGLTLCSLNAKTNAKAINGYRYDVRRKIVTWVNDNGTPRRHHDEVARLISKLTFAEFSMILDAIKEKHVPIRDLLASGIGRTLQNTDSKVAELVLRHFTDRNIPCLGVHDSFIVAKRYVQELEDVMRAAILDVAGVRNVIITRKDSIEQTPSKRYLKRLTYAPASLVGATTFLSELQLSEPGKHFAD